MRTEWLRSQEQLAERLRSYGISERMVRRMAELPTPEVIQYMPLTPKVSSVINLHGARAKRKHIGQPMMRTLGSTLSNETSTETLTTFALIAELVS